MKPNPEAKDGNELVNCPDSDSGSDFAESAQTKNATFGSPLPPRQLQSQYVRSEDIIPEDAEEVMGLSISSTASYMKSPTTPAAEKARVLNSLESYFEAPETEPIDESEYAEQIDGQPTNPPAHESHSAGELQQHLAESRLPVSEQSEQSLGIQYSKPDSARATLAESFAATRRRASSGSAAVAESLRKLLPDFTKLSLNMANFMPGKPVSNEQESIPNMLGGRQTDFASRQISSFRPSPLRRDVTASTETRRSPQAPTDLDSGVQDVPGFSSLARSYSGQRRRSNMSFEQSDGMATSLLSPNSIRSPGSLRRSNSMDSLFLDRRLTGASSFDDYSRFSEVTEQANSRFKAIADTLADSNFRLPKLPGISLASLRPTAERTHSDEVKQTTILNAERSAPTGSVQRSPLTRKGDGGKLEYTAPSQRAHPILSDCLEKMTGDVLVMGGYRGSILRTAKPPHRQLWAPVKVGLNLRKADLEVGLTDEDEERMEEKIIPSGTLSHIGPIDICRRLLRHLRKCPNSSSGKLRVHDYGYDWRLSPHLLSRRLIQYLETLECNRLETPKAQRGAWVIAHSMGGVITRHAVNQRPELFAGVVYAGTPQHCVNILGPLRNGDEVLMSSRVLTAQVNFTLRTSYALLPVEGRCFINKDSGERYDVDFFDWKTWEEYRLSPCINPPLPPLLKSRDHRKSLIGVLSDNLPMSNRRSTWFGGGDSSPSRSTDASVADSKIKNPDQSAANPEGDVKQTLEPAMGSSNPRSQPWTRNQSVATSCTIPLPEAKAYLARTLSAIKQFKLETAFLPVHEQNNAYPPNAIIFGKTVPTVYGARVASREAIKHADAFDELAFAVGDGVVLASAAQLPPGYRCVRDGRVETERGHVGLLGDLEGVGRCLGAIVEARRRGVGLGREAKQAKSRD